MSFLSSALFLNSFQRTDTQFNDWNTPVQFYAEARTITARLRLYFISPKSFLFVAFVVFVVFVALVVSRFVVLLNTHFFFRFHSNHSFSQSS